MNNDIKEAFRIIREAYDKNKTDDSVPYTQQDTLMTNTLQSAKQEFGADFNDIQNPMLYWPKDGDITLSGIIPELNDAKFQFRYKVGDGAGCYVWSNPYMPISDKTIQILSKVNGVCKNWRDEISKSEDCKPSNYRDPNDSHPETQQGQTPMDNTEGQMNPNGGQDAQQQGQMPMNERRVRPSVNGDDIELFSSNKNFKFRPGNDLD